MRRPGDLPRPEWGTGPGLGVGALLLTGLLLASCGSSGTKRTYESAAEATAAQDWPRAAELWYSVHREEVEKTPTPYLETARALYQNGDAESACAMLDQGLQAFPYDVLLLSTKGRMLQECGFNRAAEAIYARLVDVDRDNVQGLVALGSLRMELGLERAAAAPLEQLVSLGAADAHTHEQLGEIYQLRGESLGALEHYARAIELGSEDPKTLVSAVRLARDPELRRQLPDADLKALDWLDRLTSLCPQYTTAHHLRGLALAEAGRKEDAIVALRRAVETDPGHLEALVLLAELYVETGDREAAGEMISRALQLEPDESCRKVLDALLQEDG